LVNIVSYEFLMLTVGGAPSVRKYWSSFVQDTRILVYVVDSTDEKRLPESFNELHRILGDERLVQVPIIIVASKQVRCVLLGQTLLFDYEYFILEQSYIISSA
jgi:GTPase SAR1 family protein